MTINKTIASPKEAVGIAKNLLLDKNKEHFIGIYLSARNTVKRTALISMGTLNANLVHPRETFRPALVSRAASLIVLHNHPSGCVEPSEADIEITSRLKKAGELLGIKLADHVIFDSGNKLYSFKDEKAI